MIAGLNALLLGVMVYVSRVDEKHQLLTAILIGIVLYLIELAVAIGYLWSRGGKGASKAVFGKD